jgi:MFS family permease
MPHLPFQFSGGFALPTKIIGFILSAQGFIQMFVTLFVFPYVNRKIGSLATFRLVIISYPLLYLLVPYLTLVPASLRMPSIYFVLVWKVTAQALSYPSLAIMLANASPSRKVLGTLNGVAASSASLCRAFGPTLSGLVQSLGLSVGVMGLPWWANSFVAIIGALLSLQMIEENRRYTKAEKANLDVEHLPFLDADVLESLPVEEARR